MADKKNPTIIFEVFDDAQEALSIHQIQLRLPIPVVERTLRRWLSNAVKDGKLKRIGNKRNTQYLKVSSIQATPTFKFLQEFSENKQYQILKQIRDLWTHTSTAIEGNTLTLGDTHFILEEGLTVSGKPIKEHQEILGHASAIELVYLSVNCNITETFFFDLHRSVQTEVINDIDKPYGAWKVRANGTYTIGADEKSIYLEYALPQHVATLMKQVINLINDYKKFSFDLKDAPIYYAKIHAAIAHIHPFWDGNGRIARLAANIPLLSSGLPPIVIPVSKRREYIQILAKYEFESGQLNAKSGIIPKPELLEKFNHFCLECYQETLNIIS